MNRATASLKCLLIMIHASRPITIAFIISLAIVTCLAGCSRADTGATFKDVEAGLSENTAWSALKHYDPAAYKALANDLSAELADGVPRAKLIDDLGARVTAIALKQRLPTASDQAVLAFAHVTTKEMGEIRRQDPNACVRWLFPTQGTSVDLRSYVSQELRDGSYAALAEVIKSSAEDPQPIPALAEVAADQQLIASKLREQYGDKVGLLQRVHDPSVDATTVCAMAADSYGYILQLSPERSARLLRYSYSKMQ